MKREYVFKNKKKKKKKGGGTEIASMEQGKKFTQQIPRKRYTNI